MNIQEKITNFVIGDLVDDIEFNRLRRIRFLIILSLAAGISSMTFGIIHLFIPTGLTYSRIAWPIVFLFYLLTPFSIRYFKKEGPVALIICSVTLVYVMFRAFDDNYIQSPIVLWLMIIPSYCALLVETLYLYLITFSALFLVMLLMVFDYLKNPNYHYTDWMIAISVIVGMLLALVLTLGFEKDRALAEKESFELEKKILEEQKIEAIGAMVSGVSHEINNPLTIIIGTCEVLKKQKQNRIISLEKIKLHAEKMRSNIDRISKIISLISDYSQTFEDQKMQVFDVKGLTENLLVIFGRELSKYQIKVELTTAGQTTLVGHPKIIEFVLTSLIKNAIEAIIDLDQRWIRIHLSQKRNYLSIQVTDSGKGISRDVQQKIMSAFFTTKDVGQGLGLSLMASKRYVEVHRGKIQYLPEKSNTTFEVILPRGLS